MQKTKKNGRIYMSGYDTRQFSSEAAFRARFWQKINLKDDLSNETRMIWL